MSDSWVVKPFPLNNGKIILPKTLPKIKGGKDKDPYKTYKIGLAKQRGKLSIKAIREVEEFAKKNGCTKSKPFIPMNTSLTEDDLFPFKETDMKHYSIITDDLGTEKYRRRTGEPKRTNHWGQRKLFLSELILFNEVLKKKIKTPEDWKRVVFAYAGSAAGRHLVMLAEMFPIAKFILYDPNRFSDYLYDYAEKDTTKLEYDPENGVLITDRFEFHTSGYTMEDDKKIPRSECGFMTGEVAKELRDRSEKEKWILVFASDIRTLNQDEDEDETDEKIQQNMTDQATWVKIMNPAMSLLKFRLSWRPGKTRYLKGDIYFQYYCGNSSTEGRLLTDEDEKLVEIDYDNTHYESVQFYHNKNVRMNLEFRNILFYIEPHLKNYLRNDYDSVGEINAFEEYFNLTNKKLINDEKIRNIINYSKDLDFACSEFRTLEDGGEISDVMIKVWELFCDLNILDRRLNKKKYKNATYNAYYISRNIDKLGTGMMRLLCDTCA